MLAEITGDAKNGRITIELSPEVKALIKAARVLDYVLDLFDICEEGTGAKQYYEMRRALAACKDIPCE